ncbi:MAG: hypothetical protein JWQ04_639 [Pedosphaera sp.]|nr:hypothetical protein [Pedosphaera sp.]
MRRFAWVLLGGLLLAGCAGSKDKRGTFTFQSSGNVLSSPKESNGKIIISPETSSAGKVVSVNGNSRFVVLNFPVGTVPALGKRLNAYRQGLKVGELKVTGPQQDENTVADITSGEIQIGDEIRGN